MFGKYLMQTTSYPAEYSIVAYRSVLQNSRYLQVLSDLKWVILECTVHLSKPVCPVTDQRNRPLHCSYSLDSYDVVRTEGLVCFPALAAVSKHRAAQCSADSARYGFAHLSPWVLHGRPFCCRCASFLKHRLPLKLMAWP